MKRSLVRLGRYMSLVLRHESILSNKIDKNGWVLIDDLIDSNNELTEQIIEEIVSGNDKKRFEYNNDKTKIRACQGHTLNVDVNHESVPNPQNLILFHGTVLKNLNSILEDGLSPMMRKHVHLTDDLKTAFRVGKRYGKNEDVIIIAVRFAEEDLLLKSRNGVFLSNEIKPNKIVSVFRGGLYDITFSKGESLFYTHLGESTIGVDLEYNPNVFPPSKKVYLDNEYIGELNTSTYKTIWEITS